MLSVFHRLFQRDPGIALVEFGLIAGLIALGLLAMSSAPQLAKTAFISQDTKIEKMQIERELQLWELVTTDN